VSSTAEEIRSGLALTRSQDSIDAIKLAAIRALEAVDERVEIKSTEYFNHTTVPDLIMSWPHINKEAKRSVYLRFSQDARWVTEDVILLSASHPLIFGLEPSKGGEGEQELALASVLTDTLVTDPNGFDELIRGAELPGVAPLLVKSSLRGGRGYVDANRARRLTEDLPNGFSAARAGSAELTAVAVQHAGELFQSAESDRVVRLLQAMWESSGQPVSQFPGEERPLAGFRSDSLQFLLAEADLDDPGFWRAVGSGVSLELLRSLDDVGAARNFQYFMAANLDRLRAKACRVKPAVGRQMGDLELEWSMESGLVALSGAGYQCFLATRVGDLAAVPSESLEPLTVAALSLRSSETVIESLALRAGDRAITYSSETRTDVSRDEQLVKLAAAAGVTDVHGGTVYSKGRRLDLNFATATANARTNSMPPIADLLTIALPLLWTLSTEAIAALMALLPVYNGSNLERDELDVGSTSGDAYAVVNELGVTDE
jgi:hypothetical protein